MALTIHGPAIQDEIRRAGEEVTRLARVWVQDLISFVPAGPKARWARAIGLRGPLVIAPDPTGAFREMDSSGEPLSLEDLVARTRRRSLVLRVAEEQILRRRLELPAAVVARLDAALDINLRNWTPFDPAEVYAAACPLAEAPPRSSTLQAVELRCVLRAGINDRIEALQSLGFDPDAIELGDARFLISRPTLKRRRMRRRSWLAAGLTLLLLIQGLAGYALLTNSQHDEIARLEAARDERVAALRRQAKMEKEAAARRDGMRKIVARLEESLSFSQALRHLGVALPQDTVIREFEAGRDRAEGHAVILGSADLDVVASLSATGFYRVGDLGIQPGTEAGRKTFSAGFAVIPWLQTNGQEAR